MGLIVMQFNFTSVKMQIWGEKTLNVIKLFMNMFFFSFSFFFLYFFIARRRGHLGGKLPV